MKYGSMLAMTMVMVLGLTAFGASAACSGGGNATASAATTTVASAKTTLKAEDARFADISHDELVKLVADKKVVLIDCNGTDSFKAGHIPGAIDFQAASADLASKLPQDKNAIVVAYCGSEACSAYREGAEAALKLGYTNVKHLPEGISGWLKSGAQTEKSM